MLNRIETSLARIISYICHPTLMPAYSLIILFNMQIYFSMVIPAKAKIMITILIFITTALLPMLLAVLMTKLGIIRTLQMNEREERIWPFALTAIFYYISYYLIKQLDISPVFILFMLGAFITVVVGLIISFFWKISIHMIGMGGTLGAFTGLSLKLMIDIPLLIVLLILLSGLTGFARLKLAAHTPAQVLSGFLTGFTIFMVLILAR